MLFRSVSDKTVSKWERGLSMPNVVLLIPIADILEVTVTELLRGEKIDTQKNIDRKEIEELVVGSLDMAVRDSIHQHRKNWILAYLLCFFISITEIIMLVVSESSLAEHFAYKLTADRESANDLVQDCLLKALDNKEKFVHTDRKSVV